MILPQNNRSILQPHLGTSKAEVVTPIHVLNQEKEADAGIPPRSLRRQPASKPIYTGDITFAPIVWDPNKGRFIPDFEVEHTYRDEDAFEKWSLARDSEHWDR